MVDESTDNRPILVQFKVGAPIKSKDGVDIAFKISEVKTAASSC